VSYVRDMPTDLRFENGGVVCDLLVGPCACGAWHSPEERIRQIAQLDAENEDQAKTKLRVLTDLFAIEGRMKGLIEALTIFLKYGDVKYPTHCEHDVLMIVGYGRDVSVEDAKRLEELGFSWSDDRDHEGWISFRYGSA